MWSPDSLLISRHGAGLAVLLAIVTSAAARAELKAGEMFPSLGAAAVTALGANASVPEMAGKVVLVDFWASWCAPCKASFPAMAKLHHEFAARGFAVVAVGVDEKLAAATAFWRRMAPPFAGVHDGERKLVKSVVVPAMPTSYLVGRDGRVRFVHEGFHGEATVRELRKQIEALLAEPTKS